MTSSELIPFYFIDCFPVEPLSEQQQRDWFIEHAGKFYDDISRLGGVTYTHQKGLETEMKHIMRVFVYKQLDKENLEGKDGTNTRATS